MSSPPRQRRRLAQELEALRKAAGLNQGELAGRIGFKQSYVSRVESGDRVPAIPTVEAWARATGASTEMRLELADLTHAVHLESVRLEDASDDQPSLQLDIAEQEAAATALRNFQSVLVPGLLQIRPYARRVAELVRPSETPDAWERTADNRMARQRILDRQDKKLDFLLTEAALWWRPGPVEVLRAQLRHLAAIEAPNISFGIVPRTAEMPTLLMNPFVIYEGPEDEGMPFVRVETVHTMSPVRDHEIVDRYRQRFELMKAIAIFGDEARELLDRIAEDLRRPPNE